MLSSRLWRASSSRLKSVRSAAYRFRSTPPPSLSTRLQSRLPPAVLPSLLALGLATETYYIYSSPSSPSSPASSKLLLPDTTSTAQNNALFSLPVPAGSPTPSAQGKSPVRSLSYEDAGKKLAAGQHEGKIGDVNYHVLRLASNEPVEDQWIVDERDGWGFWGVLDGHAGWATSSYLKDTLTPHLSGSLKTTATEPTTIIPTIKQSFLALDRDIFSAAEAHLTSTNPSSSDGVSALAPAIAGSCALLACYNPSTSKLYVANVGDSRAVLGRYDASTGRYTAIPLSFDQTGFNADEVTRINALHPNEDDILDPKSGRLLGIAVTRAFGDHRWKWGLELIDKAREKYGASKSRPGTRTPPYMTAEPEVSETVVKAGSKGDFVVLASDGLWDNISSEDAIACVEKWLNTPAGQRKAGAQTPQPPSAPADGSAKRKSSYFFHWRAAPEYFVVEDQNAATSLARNAFGGSRRELFRALMSAYPPVSRNLRDDITVQVVFFGDQEK